MTTAAPYGVHHTGTKCNHCNAFTVWERTKNPAKDDTQTMRLVAFVSLFLSHSVL